MHAPDDQGYVDYVTARLPTLHRTAYLMCRQPTLADDVVQQTLTTLFQHWRRIARLDNVDGYVHRMLIRKLVDFRRQRWTKVVLLDSPPEQPSVDATEGFAQRDEVARALALLPPRQRAVVILRYLCDQSIDDTAAILGCSTGTVKSQASHGLGALRPLLSGLAIDNGHHRNRMTQEKVCR